MPKRTRLARVSSETLESAYDAWLQARIEHAAFLAECQQEKERIDRQGEFLVGTVRAAGSEKALAKKGDPLGQFQTEAQEQLAKARAALEKRRRLEGAAFAKRLRTAQEAVLERVKRYASKARPKLKLTLQPVGKDRSILHVARLSPDEAVLALWALAERIPSRYGFLFDDATDDVSQAPAPLYPDEGVVATRPDAQELKTVLENASVWPVKGHIPVLVPTPGGKELFRMLERGPVMEVELADGASFRNLLTHDEGQRFAGHLLRQKIEGRIDLVVEAG